MSSIKHGLFIEKLLHPQLCGTEGAFKSDIKQRSLQYNKNNKDMKQAVHENDSLLQIKC